MSTAFRNSLNCHSAHVQNIGGSSSKRISFIMYLNVVGKADLDRFMHETFVEQSPDSVHLYQAATFACSVTENDNESKKNSKFRMNNDLINGINDRHRNITYDSNLKFNFSKTSHQN